MKKKIRQRNDEELDEVRELIDKYFKEMQLSMQRFANAIMKLKFLIEENGR